MKIEGVRMEIDGVEVLTSGIFDLLEEEAREYVSYVRSKIKENLVRLTISPGKDPEDVILSWEARGEKFERIRRITGYLVGTIDRWNNAKKAEERERVKHT